MAVDLKITTDEKAGVATATVHMPGQTPLEVATLRGGFASGDPEVFDRWTNFLQFALTKFLVNHGQQIKRVTKSGQAADEPGYSVYAEVGGGPRRQGVESPYSCERVRGPYRHQETAAVVRRELEDRFPNKQWNLKIVEESLDPKGRRT